MRLHTDYVNDTYIDAKLVQALYAGRMAVSPHLLVCHILACTRARVMDRRTHSAYHRGVPYMYVYCHARMCHTCTCVFMRARVYACHMCVSHTAPEVEAYLKKAQPFAPRLPLEDYNKAAVILDVDGNAWSDRLSMIVHFPTPLLKQVREQSPRLV